MKSISTNDYKFRFIKMELWDGQWKYYFNPSLNRLNNLIKRNNPKNIYKSVNQYIRHKELNKTYSNLILKRNLLIDIDGQNFKNKKECKKYFESILKFLKENNIKINEINLTNQTTLGFQILIDSSSYNQAEELINENPEIFSQIDKVFDENRVMRFVPSWNGNKNSYSIPLFTEGLNSLPSLENHPQRYNRRQAEGEQIPLLQSKSKGLNTSELREICNTTLRQGFLSSPLFTLPFNALGMPQIMQNREQPLEHVFGATPSKVEYLSQGYFEADDNWAVRSLTHPVQNKGRVSEIKSNRFCHLFEISNSVYGTKELYIPVFKMSKLSNTSIKRLKRLQKAYNLGDLWIMRHNKGFDAFGLKCLEKRRLEKILRAYRKGLYSFQKYHQQWLYLGNIVDYLPYISNGQYSKPHSNFFRLNYPNLIGNGKVKVFEAYIGEKLLQTIKCVN